MQYDALFTPIQIGSLTLKNRFVMAPMSMHMTSDGSLTDKEITFFETRAKGDVAMIIMGSMCIKPDGNFGGQTFIESDDRIAPLKKLTDTIHRHGCLMCAQIHHAGRETNKATSGYVPVAPSYFEPESFFTFKAEYDPPKVLSIEEVEEYIESYAQAVRRAKEAGFDACELHCAHGYLICSFMSPLTNKRTDKYGGSFLGRMRFIKEILERSYELVGRDYPITCRIVGDELRENGIDMDLSIQIAQYLEKLGVAALSVSVDMYPYVRTVPNMYHKHAVNLYLAESIKQSVSIPVMAAGQLDRPNIQLDALNKDKLDVICIGRTLIADPNYLVKLQEGRLDEIIYCIACNKGCHDRSADDRYVKCGRNVQTGREYDEAFQIKPALEAKEVIVIGAGPSGMEAARLAALRGHKVSIYDENPYLGGRLRLAAVPPHKTRYGEVCDDLERDLKKLNVEINTNSKITEEVLMQKKADAIVLATGSVPFVPPIKGISQDFVVGCDDILSQKASAGLRVAIIGGGAVGTEVAHYLMEEEQREVYLIEMADEVANGSPQDSRIKLYEFFSQTPDLHILTKTKLLEIGSNEITVEKEGEILHIKDLDTVIMSVGLRSNRSLKECAEKVSKEVYIVGDAVQPKDYVSALYQGFVAGNTI